MALNSISFFRRIVILIIIGFLIIILIYFYFVEIDYEILNEGKDLKLSISIQQPTINITKNYEISTTAKPKMQTINETASHFNPTNINLQTIWNCLYYHYILYPKYISPLNISIQNNCDFYSDLISSSTIEYFLQLTNSSINNHPEFVNHRYHLSLRRYIMLISNSLNITSSRIVQNIFQSLHKIHNITQKQLNNSLSTGQKKYFLIHIPKAGGTSVCKTFNMLGFRTTRPESQNCNIRRTQASFKSWDWGIMPCRKYFNKAINLDLLAYERNMHGHGMSSIPILCDQFVYILPFRHPLKRIYSFLDHCISKPQRQPTDFIVQRTILSHHATDEEIRNCINKYIDNMYMIYHHTYDSPHVCTMKVFDVINNQTGEHMIYTPPYNASDLSGFFKSLYRNESTDDVVTKVNLTAKYSDIGALTGGNYYCNRDPGVYKLYWFGSNKYNKYGFKVAMNWSWGGQRIEKFNFDFMKGHITNLYTRSFGYNHTQDKRKITYDAFYAKNDEITIDHVVNSVGLMMGIDYILPFENRFDHSIWKYLFDSIENEHGKGKFVHGWYHLNTGLHKENKFWINSKNIEQALSEEEKSLLHNKNKFDMMLYEIANDIADVDMLFYDSNGIK